MNKVIITGRISNDLEIRKTQNGKAVLEASVAVNRERKNEDGTYPADFLRVYCWEKKAEYLSNYARKGTLIGVSGRIETSSFVNKNGQKIYQTYITAEQVEILRQPQEKAEPVHSDKPSDSFGGENYGFSQEELPFY